jgi:AAHS family 4-hydroxybenzoate transporter-like MFS transporter
MTIVRNHLSQDRTDRCPDSIDPSSFIDNQPIGRFQIATFVLCIVITFFDGFDIQALALTAPVISKEWHLAPSAFGPVFSATLAGFMAGQIIFGRLADQFGRRVTLIGAVLIFGAFTLGCAFAHDWWTLLLLRVPVGIGLGGAVPIVLALTAELAPKRKRSLVIGVVSSGYCLGAVGGGYVAGVIAANGYWQGVFLIGGIGPLLLCVAMLFMLPESPAFLARSARHAQLRKMMRKTFPHENTDSIAFDISPDGTEKLTLADLFNVRYRYITIPVWITYFLVILSFYCVVSWLPVLMIERGMSLYLATWVFIAFNVGGGIGGIMIGRFIDRFNPLVILPGAYFVGAALFIITGFSDIAWPAILIIMGISGFFIIGGGQFGLAAYVTILYPAAIRTTGMGAALAFGRIGGIIGPLLGGVILAAQLPSLNVFNVVGLIGIATGLVFLKFGPRRVAPTVEAQLVAHTALIHRTNESSNRG